MGPPLPATGLRGPSQGVRKKKGAHPEGPDERPLAQEKPDGIGQGAKSPGRAAFSAL